MKIGILRLPVGVGGAEVSLTEIGTTLFHAGHDVWFHFDDGPHVRRFNAFGSLKERVGPYVRAQFARRNFSEDWAVSQLADTDVALIIHRSHFPERLATAVSAVPKKIVYVPGKNEHHVTGRHEAGPPHGSGIASIHRFVFNSRHTLRGHLRAPHAAALKARFQHLHPPMDLDFYAALPLARLRAEGRARLGLTETTFAIGVFGRLIPSKEPLAAVELASTLRGAGPPTRLFFIGDGPLRAAVEREVGRRKLTSVVTVLGMNDSPFRDLVSMDAILHLCQHESMSRALREAMFLERPVVAFDGAGNRELCAGPLARLLFRDLDQARTKLVHLATNPGDRALFARRSRQRILDMERDAVRELRRLVEGA